MCVGDFLSTSIEEIKRINLGYGNDFRAVEYDAFDEYKNKLKLFLQERSK